MLMHYKDFVDVNAWSVTGGTKPIIPKPISLLADKSNQAQVNKRNEEIIERREVIGALCEMAQSFLISVLLDSMIQAVSITNLCTTWMKLTNLYGQTGPAGVYVEFL